MSAAAITKALLWRDIKPSRDNIWTNRRKRYSACDLGQMLSLLRVIIYCKSELIVAANTSEKSLTAFMLSRPRDSCTMPT